MHSLVLLGLLAVTSSVVGEGEGGDLRLRCCEQPSGSVQIVQPAPGAWVPMDKHGDPSVPEPGGALSEDNRRERTGMLLEFVVVDPPLLAWLPLGLLPLAPELLPNGTFPSAERLDDRLLADVLVDGKIWGTVDLQSCIFAGITPSDMQRRSGDAKASQRGWSEDEARYWRDVKQERDEILAEWSRKATNSDNSREGFVQWTRLADRLWEHGKERKADEMPETVEANEERNGARSCIGRSSDKICAVEVRIGSLMDAQADRNGVADDAGSPRETAAEREVGVDIEQVGGTVLPGNDKRWSRKLWVTVEVRDVARGPRTLSVELRSKSLAHPMGFDGPPADGSNHGAGGEGEARTRADEPACASVECGVTMVSPRVGLKSAVEVHVGGLITSPDDPFSVPSIPKVAPSWGVDLPAITPDCELLGLRPVCMLGTGATRGPPPIGGVGISGKSECAHHASNRRGDAGAWKRPRGPLKELTIGVLGGFPKGARESLMHSLRSWKDVGLLSSVYETLIFLQDISETDFTSIPRELDLEVEGDEAGEMGGDVAKSVRILGARCNIGIGRAMLTLVQQANSRYFMFLEDDWILPFHREHWEPIVGGGLRLLREERADFVRLKSDEASPQLEAHLGDGYHYVLNCARFQPPHAPHFFCACLDVSMQPPVGDVGGGWGGKPPEEAFHDIEICLDADSRVLPRRAFATRSGTGGSSRGGGREVGRADDGMEAWRRLEEGESVGAGERLGHDGGTGGEREGVEGVGGGEHIGSAGAGAIFYCMPSRICKHTNTPSLVARDSFLRWIGPVAALDPGIRITKHYLEESLNITWPHRHFVVAVPSSGLFMHVEMDDKAPGTLPPPPGVNYKP